MLTTKSVGTISCHQRTRNGTLEFSNILPAECRLSKSLKTMITPVLQGLLEINPRRIIKFPDFFNAIRRIFSMKVLEFFLFV